MRWLTLAEAAERVGRDVSTLYRWAREDRLLILNGRVLERQLLETDRVMRHRRGRPPKWLKSAS